MSKIVAVLATAIVLIAAMVAHSSPKPVTGWTVTWDLGFPVGEGNGSEGYIEGAGDYVPGDGYLFAVGFAIWRNSDLSNFVGFVEAAYNETDHTWGVTNSGSLLGARNYWVKAYVTWVPAFGQLSETYYTDTAVQVYVP